MGSEIKPVLQATNELCPGSKKTIFSADHPTPVYLELCAYEEVPFILWRFLKRILNT